MSISSLPEWLRGHIPMFSFQVLKPSVLPFPTAKEWAVCAAVGSPCGCWKPRGAGSCVRRGRWFPFGRLLHMQDGLLPLKHSPGARQLMARRGSEALGQVGQVLSSHLGLVTVIWQRGFPSGCQPHIHAVTRAVEAGPQSTWPQPCCLLVLGNSRAGRGVIVLVAVPFPQYFNEKRKLESRRSAGGP